MKLFKIWLPICLLFGIIRPIHAQSDYNLLEIAHQLAQSSLLKYDAAEKQWYFSPEESATTVYVPLLYQAVGQPGDTTLPQVLDRMMGNPFIGRSSDGSLIWIMDDAKMGASVLGAIANRGGATHANSQGFRVTTVADGIAKFLVSRAKEELSIAFFRQFKDDLQKDTLLGSLFPSTTATLGLIDEQVYQYARYIEALRESFIRDFKVMPTNLNNYLTNQNIIKNPVYQILSGEALEISQVIINGTSTEEMIDFLAYRGPVQDKLRISALPDSVRGSFIDMAAGFQTSGLVSHSLYASGSGYLEPYTVSEYLSDRQTRLIYYGLLWQHCADIRFSNSTALQTYLGNLAVEAPMAENFAKLIKDFAHKGQKSEMATYNGRAAIAAGGEETAYEPYYEFFSALLDLFETGVQVKKTIAQIQHKSATWEDTLFVGIRHLNDLNFDVRQRRYAAAVNDLMYVLRVFFPNLDSGVRKKIFNYGQFIASVATADNSDEVAAAIEAVALPAGSSRIKKQNYFSSAINAYTGGHVSYEHLSTGERDVVAGLSAPVGITASWKLKSKAYDTPPSFSLFAPIIDVGALATYRFNDPTSSDLPDLSWSNLLSPGLYAVLGFANDIPMSIGAGVQRGPNLRTISSSSADIKASGFRYGVFLAVDIPMFNLVVQGEKKPKNKSKGKTPPPPPTPKQ